MLCYGLLFIMWCDAPSPVATDSYCSIARPIYWNAKDTRKTKEAVDTHNRVWKATCRKTS